MFPSPTREVLQDNRLRVERDELQHAQREAERKKAERKEARLVV